MDFANNFPDEQIYDALGDRITVTASDGSVRFIQGVFDYIYEDEELGDMLSVEIPFIDCPDYVAAEITDDVITYNSESYIVDDRRPIDTGVIRLFLRTQRLI